MKRAPLAQLSAAVANQGTERPRLVYVRRYSSVRMTNRMARAQHQISRITTHIVARIRAVPMTLATAQRVAAYMIYVTRLPSRRVQTPTDMTVLLARPFVVAVRQTSTIKVAIARLSSSAKMIHLAVIAQVLLSRMMMPIVA